MTASAVSVGRLGPPVRLGSARRDASSRPAAYDHHLRLVPAVIGGPDPHVQERHSNCLTSSHSSLRALWPQCVGRASVLKARCAAYCMPQISVAELARSKWSDDDMHILRSIYCVHALRGV